MASRRRALPVVLWMLVAVVALSLSAAHVRPSLVWPLAVAAVFLPVSCLLLLVFVVPAAFRRMWISVALSTMLILGFLSRHVSPDRLSRPIRSADDLIVMTYNAPKHPDDERAQREVTDLITTEDPDLVALQESVVWAMRRQPDELRVHRKFSRLIDSLGYQVDMPPRGGGERYNYTHWKPPVLSKIGPVRQTQVDLGPMEAGISRHSILRTEVEWRGRTLVLYNVHLPSHGSSKPWTNDRLFSLSSWLEYAREIRDGFYERERHVDIIRDLIENETLPVVLVGDFNGTPDSWTYQVLSKGLVDVYRATGSGWGATYHADRPAVRIDFVLVDSSFEPVAAHVPRVYPYSSDHRPLVVRFRWREKQSRR